jgi:hypothetical protein
MALPDLTGINIENSYQRVVHTDGVNFYNGTGSLLNLGQINTGSFATTGSNRFNGNQTITGSLTVSGSGVTIDNILRVTRAGGSVGFIIDGGTGKVTGGGAYVAYEPYNYGDATHNFNIAHPTVGSFNWSAGTNTTLSSNTQLMKLTRDGALGLGSTTPGAKMDIITGSNRYALRLGENTANTDGSWTGIKFQLSTNTSNSDTQDGAVSIRANRYSAGSQLQILNGPTVVATFGGASSNLLLGTTTDLGYKLDVSGSVRITNNAVITGSLIVRETGGDEMLNTSTSTLNRLGVISVDWRNRTLNNGAESVILDWENNLIYDTLGNPSIDWENRVLWDLTGAGESIDYGRRRLYNSTGDVVLNYNTGTFAGTAATASYVTPLNQNVQITGSLSVSGSVIINNVDIQSTIIAMAIALG